MSGLSELAQHRWLDIYRAFGLDDKILSGKHCPCPLCGGKDRFRYTDFMGTGGVICNQCMPPEEGVDGIEFLKRYTSQSFKQVAKEIRDVLGETQARPAQGQDVAKNKAKLNKIWGEAKPLSKGCLTHRYLYNRGIRTDFASLTGIRCHEGLDYWQVEDGKPVRVGNWPAMVGLVSSVDGKPATLHITYLALEATQLGLNPSKKILPVAQSYNGGAVRLEKYTGQDVLCVAEGIESALALKTLYPDACCWACISAGNMKKFESPDGASTIYIGGDNDKSFTGQAAAFELARRLSGKKLQAHVLMPREVGTDWADEVYNNETAEIFENVLSAQAYTYQEKAITELAS